MHVQSRLVTPDPELEAAIALGYQRRDRADMAPTIAYFEGLLAEHPDHPVLTYEVAGAYDTAGQETEARIRYEEALRLGLSGENLRRCLCQYGSTLRWLGDFDASLAVLERGLRRVSGFRLCARLPRAHPARGRASDEGFAEMLTIVTDHAEVTDLGRYATGLAGLANWFGEGRPD